MPLRIPCLVAKVDDISQRLDRKDTHDPHRSLVLFQAEYLLRTDGPPDPDATFDELMSLVGRKCWIEIEDES